MANYTKYDLEKYILSSGAIELEFDSSKRLLWTKEPEILSHNIFLLFLRCKYCITVYGKLICAYCEKKKAFAWDYEAIRYINIS